MRWRTNSEAATPFARVEGENARKDREATNTTASLDLSLVETPTGKVILHQAGCKLARSAAAAGWPVMTLLGCERVPRGFTTCVCLHG